MNSNEVPSAIGDASRYDSEVLLLCIVKFEQIPLFYPRRCAGPLRRSVTISTLERFVVYCSCKQIISGRVSGRGPEGTGSCSSCDGFKLQRWQCSEYDFDSCHVWPQAET